MEPGLVNYHLINLAGSGHHVIVLKWWRCEVGFKGCRKMLMELQDLNLKQAMKSTVLGCMEDAFMLEGCGVLADNVVLGDNPCLWWFMQLFCLQDDEDIFRKYWEV
ncbi:hypothetical protein Tco_0153776 [Tanacetum coccineum]